MNWGTGIVAGVLFVLWSILMTVMGADIARASIQKDCEAMGQSLYARTHIECKVLKKAP